MNMTKGKEPSNKKGGMQSHLGSSPGNNPTTSKNPDLGFDGKNKPKGNSSANAKVASNGHDNGGAF